MKVLDTHSIQRVAGGIVQTGDNWGNGEDNSSRSFYNNFACEVGATGMGNNAGYGSSSTGVANPNACSSAVVGNSGWGAAVGGAIGALGGVIGAAVGAVLGGTLAGGYTAANNPACGPTYTP